MHSSQTIGKNTSGDAALPNKAALAAVAASGGLIDCSKVLVKPDAWGGAGAFAAVAIRKGEVVERGIVRVLTNVDGNENPVRAL